MFVFRDTVNVCGVGHNRCLCLGKQSLFVLRDTMGVCV